MLMTAGAAVGPGAGAQLDLALGEMPLELGPFRLGRLAVFLAGSQRAPPGDERAVVAQHIVLVDGCAWSVTRALGLHRRDGRTTHPSDRSIISKDSSQRPWRPPRNVGCDGPRSPPENSVADERHPRDLTVADDVTAVVDG